MGGRGSGGARVGSGPPPDPQALRRDRDATEWTRLPSRRTGPVPAWPLTRATKRELTLWGRQWVRSQAVMWEAYGLVAEVAMYVRTLAAAERVGASVSSRTLVLRQADALGISTAGLRMNRWIIAADDVASPTDPNAPAPRRAPRGGSARRRLEVLSGGA